MPAYKVGDRLFSAEPRTGGRFHTGFVVITKIGRRWADISRIRSDGYGTFAYGRFDIETGKLDGGHFSAPGRVFADEAAWRAQVRLESLWREFRDKVRDQYLIPDRITDINILKAADALNIRLKGE